MINHKHKVICIHIPKTGGTSIKKNIPGFTMNGDHKPWSVEKEIAGENWNEYFKFSIVRNPWDRMYSIYSYYKMGIKISRVSSDILPNSFKLFVIDLDKYLNILGLNYNQYDYVGDELDYIGRFENLDEAFNVIIEKINAPRTKLTKERVAKRARDYHSIYDDNMVEIVRNKYIIDIEKFNYKF